MRRLYAQFIITAAEKEFFRVYCVYKNNIPRAKWKILYCLQRKSSFSEWKCCCKIKGFVQKQSEGRNRHLIKRKR